MTLLQLCLKSLNSIDELMHQNETDFDEKSDPIEELLADSDSRYTFHTHFEGSLPEESGGFL